MRAWHVDAPGPVTGRPLRLSTDDDIPRPGPDELLLKVLACGVCRTDLHVTEGDLPVHLPGVTPGHEVVAEVVEPGQDVDQFKAGDRAGAAWLRWTDNTCKFCRRGAENLCPQSRYTGWDANGGYAEYLTVPAAYVHRLPAGYTDLELAPLLCAGIIGYHALQRADLPKNGRLGLYGFGGSAHLAAQVAMAEGAAVHGFTRGESARELARGLGAASVQDSFDPPPVKLDSAILFAPVGTLVPPALAALDRGGTLSIAGIYLTDIPPLNYDQHLFQERQLRSVTSNTRNDATEFLTIAERIKIKVTTTPYTFDQAQQALTDLSEERVHGAAVLSMP